ncbi:hypothetical protein ACP70R_028808 [Stipagrostis hirtigluma subsp. patula]
MASARVWVVAAAALALACAMVVARPAAGAEGGDAPTPSGTSSSMFGCNPLVDKTCKVETFAVDLDGDGDLDELPAFNEHMTIIGH